MNTFSIKAALATGWEKTKENISFLVLATIIMWGFSIVGDMLYNYLDQGSQGTVVDFVALGGVSLILLVGSVIMQIGYLKIFLKLHDGEDAQLEDLYNHYPLFWKFIAGRILVAIITIAGLFLLIIPGIIFAVILNFQQFFTVDKGVGPVEAIKQSWKITKGVRLKLLGFMIVLALLNILGLLLAFLGLFITIPVSLFAMVNVYRKLTSQHEVKEIPTVG